MIYGFSRGFGSSVVFFQGLEESLDVSFNSRQDFFLAKVLGVEACLKPPLTLLRIQVKFNV